MSRRLRIPFTVVALVALTLIVASSSAAKNPPKSPNDSAVAQYVEVIPGAGGAKPSSPTGPAGAAFATNGGGLGAGAVLAIVLGAIALAFAVVFVVRRRFARE